MNFVDKLPGRKTFVFHGAKFDVPFLERAFRANGMQDQVQLFRRVLCNVSLAWAPERGCLSQKKLAALFNITSSQEHDALADAIVTSKVFHAILRERSEKWAAPLIPFSQPTPHPWPQRPGDWWNPWTGPWYSTCSIN